MLFGNPLKIIWTVRAEIHLNKCRICLKISKLCLEFIWIFQECFDESALKHLSARETIWIYSDSAMESTWKYPGCAWGSISIYPECAAKSTWKNPNCLIHTRCAKEPKLCSYQNFLKSLPILRTDVVC